ncbi:MAG: hypothetical protein HYS13_20340 [Planctomycetia bacterium]|nr:hypothetical protein [Planctomycetia bacterium]
MLLTESRAFRAVVAFLALFAVFAIATCALGGERKGRSSVRLVSHDQAADAGPAFTHPDADDELPPPTVQNSRVPLLLPAAQPPDPRQAPPGALGEQIPGRRCPVQGDLKSIHGIDLDIRLLQGDVPIECPLLEAPYYGRYWDCLTFTWKASSLCHKPLYFEDVPLERYGHSQCPISQSIASGAHFFGSLAILPYKIGLEDPCECVYALGYYRPGSCAPKLVYSLPLSARGAAYQGAAVTGLVFFVP